MKAELIARVNEHKASGTQYLYRLSEPYKIRDWDWDENRPKVRDVISFIVTSSTVVPYSGPETFACRNRFKAFQKVGEGVEIAYCLGTDYREGTSKRT